jgi:hypothetical protein
MAGPSNRNSRAGASSSFRLQSLQRALSPSTQAAASAESASALSIALGVCNSVEEVINVVPTRYRESLAPLLRGMADAVERSASTRKQRAELREAVNAEKYPKWILGSIGIPSFQPMAGFAKSIHGAPSIEAFNTAMKAARTTWIDEWIKGACEVLDVQHAYYANLCSNAHMEDALQKALEARTSELVHAFPIMVANPDWNEQSPVNVAPTVPDYTSTKVRYRADEQKVQNLLQQLVESVRSVVTGRHVRRAALDQRKAALRNTAQADEDVVMADSSSHSAAGTSGLSAADIRRIIKEELKASSGVGHTAASRDSLINAWLTETEGPCEGAAFCWAAEEEEEWGQRPSASADRWTVRQRERQRESARRVMADRTWTYNDPCSYPDEILYISVPLAVKIIAWRTPLAVKEALRFRHVIHCQEGVLPPLDIVLNMGVGLRYIMPITVKPSLPLDAWNDFERRFRWFYYFTVNPSVNRGSIEYHPAFELQADNKSAGPLAPAAIESGLAAGRTAIAGWQPVEPTATEVMSRRLAPDFRGPIQDWMTKHEVIVTQTDKNLGLALIKRDWYIKETRKLLADERNYRVIKFRDAMEAIYDSVTVFSDKLRHWESVTSLALNRQLCEFLWGGVEPFLNNARQVRSIAELVMVFEMDCNSRGLPTCLLPGGEYSLGLETYRRATPLFHGLPKIHKTPWKMRPITPYHSAVLAHPARVLSQLLKDLVRTRPHVLEGTKAFCIDLQKVELDPFSLAANKYYIVTGDITAYYPNVPVQDAVRIIKTMWDFFAICNPVPLIYREIFHDLLDLVTDTRTICQFQHEYFEQMRGLAMGMHCAPDLANLYAAYFEDEFVINSPSVLFYKRFIDDIFMLIQADSGEAALEIAGGLNLPGCEIVWSTASQSAIFLDVHVWISPFGILRWKPFQKALNHTERIPWISSHPLTVKRGAFYGELSRLAILSSTEFIFRDSVKGLATLYRNRGYPNTVINNWLKEQNKRWIGRFSTKPERAASLVLKSEMNPVWNAFPLHQLADLVHAEWQKLPPLAVKRPLEDSSGQAARRRRLQYHPLVEDRLLDSADSEPGRERVDVSEQSSSDLMVRDLINRPFLLSKKRVRNANDLFNTWKKKLVYLTLQQQQDLAFLDLETSDEE